MIFTQPNQVYESVDPNAYCTGLRTPRNVSPPRNTQQTRASSTPAPNTKSVQFDDSVPDTPELSRKNSRSDNNKSNSRSHDTNNENDSYDDSYNSESSIDDRRHSRRHHTRNGTTTDNSNRHSRNSQNPNSNARKSHKDESENDSDTTIELPPRFDEHGRRKAERGEDPIADKIEDFLTGKGSAGKLFRSLTDGLLGGGDDKPARRRRRRDD